VARGDSILKRCAIYTRKSSEEGLEQNFNSLQAQRQACEAYVKSQVGEGWRIVKTAYDDGGFSGATIERPALKQLLSDIKERRVNVVVVYKVDRLTRSLADFAKMVEIFDAHAVSFVAVTQQFNTTTSMGRLTLNVLLSFAQFEREVTGERIRDKIAASKQKGMWMGGTVPLGYDVRDRLLVVNGREAETVRLIFELYSQLRSVRQVRDELDRRSIVSKTRVSKAGVRSGGVRFARGALYQMLANPIYIGEIRHKRTTHPGQHEPIIEKSVWQRVQELLAQRAARARGSTGWKTTGLLTGKLFDENGEPLYACAAKKGGSRYRYFVSRKLIRGSGKKDAPGWRLPADETERAVTAAVRQMLLDRARLARVLKDRGLGAAELGRAVETIGQKAESFGEIGSRQDWDIVERVELKTNGIQVTLNLRGLVPYELLVASEVELRTGHWVPMQLKRRGVETRLIIPGETTTASRTDPALLRAVARGYQWFTELASGTSVSTREIAMREGLSESYVRHVVPLGLLGPAMVESICFGKQSAMLSAERLKAQAGLPIEWSIQEQLLSD
jgi:site-specific DNA recombinase